jgi:hypothetical protein
MSITFRLMHDGISCDKILPEQVGYPISLGQELTENNLLVTTLAAPCAVLVQRVRHSGVLCLSLIWLFSQLWFQPAPELLMFRMQIFQNLQLCPRHVRSSIPSGPLTDTPNTRRFLQCQHKLLQTPWTAKIGKLLLESHYKSAVGRKRS